MTQQMKSTVFNYTVLEGSPYKVGQLQGEIIKQIPAAVEYFDSGKDKLSALEYAQVFRLFDEFCPGLNEEINGFADSLKMSPEQVIYYANTYLKTGYCCHMAVLPSQTENNHLFVGRSYEFGDEQDDYLFCTTRLDGKFAHLGCTVFFFGRMEGINEHGLAVTMSAAGIPVSVEKGMTPPVQNGFQFWAMIRAILEQCETLEKALDLVKAFPLCCNTNLMISHKSGTAALMEISGPHKAVKRIDASTDEQWLCSTNHFTLPEMIPHIPTAMQNSFVRYNTLTSRLTQAAPHVTKETLRGILSDTYPNGVCCHYFQEWFGTLRSLIFDVTDGTVGICFGPPSVNPWHTFDFKTATAPGQYQITFPLEQATPDFWPQVSIESRQ